MREYETPPLSLLNESEKDIETQNVIKKDGMVFFRVSSFRRSIVYITGLSLSAFNFWLCKDASTSYQIVSCTSGFLFFVAARYY